MAPPPLFRNFQPAVPNQNSLTTDNSPKSTVNSTIQAPAPRRKFVDEGKLRKVVFTCLYWSICCHKDTILNLLVFILFIILWFFLNFVLLVISFPMQISGRLFSDSGPRRSSRLSADSGANTNASVATVSGNGNNTSKYLGGSKLGSLGLRSVTLRKGNSWANENMDEGCDITCTISPYFY